MPGYQGFALYLAAMMFLWLLRKRGMIELFAAIAFLVAYVAFMEKWVAVAALLVPLAGFIWRKKAFSIGNYPLFIVLAVYYWLVICAIGLHF